MCRIFEEKRLCQIVKETWNDKVVPKVLDQVEREKSSNTRLRKAFSVLFSEGSTGCKFK